MKMSPNVKRELKRMISFVLLVACGAAMMWLVVDFCGGILPPVPTESHVVIEADVQAKVRAKVDEYNDVTAKVGTLLMASRGLKDDDPDIKRKQKPFEDAMEALEIKLGLIALEIEEMEYMPNLVAKRIVERHKDLRKRTTVRIPMEGEMELSLAQGQKVDIGETTVCFFNLEGDEKRLGVGVNPTGFLGFDMEGIVSKEYPISIRGVRFVFVEKEKDGFLFKLEGEPGTWISMIDPIE